MELGTFIASSIEWVWQLCPRMECVRNTHRGVAWTWGDRVREIKPGVFWYWPVATEYEIIPVVRQTINLPTQVVETLDGQQIVIGASIIYSIKDVVKAMGERAYDIDTTITDLAMAAIAATVSVHNYPDLRVGLWGHHSDNIQSLTQINLESYGVQVEAIQVTDFSRCRTYKFLGAEMPS